MSFLIDSGSDTSIIVVNRKELKLPDLQTFSAANGTQIDVYGTAVILESFANFLLSQKQKKNPRSNTHNSIEHLEWKVGANISFKDSKDALVNATLLRHPILRARLSLWADANYVATGDSITQLSSSQWEPLAFYSTKAINIACLDRFSRWQEVIRTPGVTAETTARALMHGWISRFGWPVAITTDRGINFQSNLFRELTRILSCNKIRSSAYHSQANRSIERLQKCS
ncbi:transposon Ty3-I Gag-Pol polyprotein [Nephila pilipes]|uniref:Transposon Ty3-I Gag-Pol polyprotein n=1 Tax=Nephila pilipes TaxID=299642 RepID=A0A8X6IBF3_NEPPI|nr:transposon Ty3-I Gag-Pol polyprotein [Nephila pilipes]